MKIDISKLEEGDFVDLEHDYDPKQLNLELHDLHYSDILRLKGRLERGRDAVFFKGTLRAKLEILCTRCLKPVVQSAEETFDLYYPYRNEEFLDTTDDIREVIILSYPVKFICDENCNGLCPECGINLNKESCSCKLRRKGSDSGSPFSRLADWHKGRAQKSTDE